MQRTTVHLALGLMWALYGIIVGPLIIIYNYMSVWGFLSIVVAIIGNSAHLIAMQYSKSGIEIRSSEPPKTD